jgi:Fungal specific transcription factor domain
LFFSTVFPLLPILHVPAFADDFRTFWEERNSSKGHDSEIGVLVRRKPGFVCLLSSMLFAALKCSPKSQLQNTLGENPDLTAGDMYILAVISTIMTGFPRRPSLYSLAAYILTQSPFVMEEDFSDFPDFISTSFRVALGMGLHRHIPEAAFSTDELETRRRLWWYIIHLDVMASASSGLSPLFIDDRMTNVEMISEYDRSGDNYVREGHQSKPHT